MTTPGYDPALLDPRSALAPLSKLLAPPYDLISRPEHLGYLRLVANLGLDDCPELAARLAEVEAERQQRRSFVASGTCGSAP